jgi:hypothetical protein
VVVWDGTDIDFDRGWLFNTGNDRHRLAKHVVIGELERFEGDELRIMPVDRVDGSWAYRASSDSILSKASRTASTSDQTLMTTLPI